MPNDADKFQLAGALCNAFRTKERTFYTLLSGVSCVLPSFTFRQQKNCIVCCMCEKQSFV